MTKLRNEASEAVQTLAHNLGQARIEQQSLKAEAERVVRELRDLIARTGVSYPRVAETATPSPITSGTTTHGGVSVSPGDGTTVAAGAGTSSGVPGAPGASPPTAGRPQIEASVEPPLGIPTWGNRPGQCTDAWAQH